MTDGMKQIDDLIESGVLRFVTMGRSTLGPGKLRHASVSIEGGMHFAQGYGDTADQAVRAAVAMISETGKKSAPRPETQIIEHDPLADMLG